MRLGVADILPAALASMTIAAGASDIDWEYAEFLAGDCMTCHQADGPERGIPEITNLPKEDFLVAMRAYKNKERSHPVMQMMAGRLSDEEIASLAAFFEQKIQNN